MGREFASSIGRWCHLTDSKAKPEIIAICDKNETLYPWYTDNFSSITQCTDDYHDLLSNPDIEAIYCAVPHNLHKDIYIDIINAGKHLLGEKPFGIDMEANNAILQAASKNPEVIIRSSSEFPYYPAVQNIYQQLQNDDFGDIIEVEAGFLHSSDMDPNKTINWKRMIEFNGEYGCMGDLGLHVFHLPLRLGWKPTSVFAQLSNLIPTRDNGKGEQVPCETWDNSTLHCNVDVNGKSFPLTGKMFRMAPGETDTWYINILGTKKSVRYSTKQPKTLWTMNYEPGKPQCWQYEDLGYAGLFPCITGHIFEFGFTDSILQMWASFVDELAGGDANGFPCASLQETNQSHSIFTAALKSQKNNSVESINYETV